MMAVGERKGKGFNVSTPPPASRGDILLILRWVYLAGRGGRVTAALKCTARLDEHDGPALKDCHHGGSLILPAQEQPCSLFPLVLGYAWVSKIISSLLFF